jgi:hypothetical protein
MKHCFALAFLFLMMTSCRREANPVSTDCDMSAVLAANASKVTISNGVWGTVSSMEGNCMPIVGPGSTCKECPVQRKVRIYEYTLQSQAIPVTNTRFYDSFSTQLIKELNTDNNGFFQTELSPGQYTIVIVENGKLYSFGQDGQGGISSYTHQGGANIRNLRMTYKAAF